MTLQESVNQRLIIAQMEKVMDEKGLKGVERTNCYYYGRGIISMLDLDMPSKFVLVKTTAFCIVSTYMDMVEYPTI